MPRIPPGVIVSGTGEADEKVRVMAVLKRTSANGAPLRVYRNVADFSDSLPVVTISAELAEVLSDQDTITVWIEGGDQTEV
jgi:hypothetical protein